jgi:RES domain-containing protein
VSAFLQPPARNLRLYDTHRLIPSRLSGQGTVLSRLTDDPAVLAELAELDGATNARLLGEEGLLPGISVYELVYGIPYAPIVNAAFTHAAPYGGRFNSADRGAWYAALERETAAAEVAFHRLQHLEEIDWPEEEMATFDDYLADFAAEFHDLTGRKPAFKRYLASGPIPECYREPQLLAANLLALRSNGILYPSVRQPRGTCLVCFRPALVYHVRRSARLEFRLLAHRPFHAAQMHELSAG